LFSLLENDALLVIIPNMCHKYLGSPNYKFISKVFAIMKSRAKLQNIISPYELVSKALGCAPNSLELDSGLGRHPNWDSFGHLEVMMALEEKYGIEIDDDTIRHFISMGAIIELSQQLLNN
jgi:acyl carrier protein